MKQKLYDFFTFIFSNTLTFLAKSGKCLISNRIGVSLIPVMGESKLCFMASIQRSQLMITSATSLFLKKETLSILVQPYRNYIIDASREMYSFFRCAVKCNFLFLYVLRKLTFTFKYLHYLPFAVYDAQCKRCMSLSIYLQIKDIGLSILK